MIWLVESSCEKRDWMKTRITASLVLSLMLTAGLLVGSSAGPASAIPGTSLNPTDRGWYQADGYHAGDNPSYYVSPEHRNYFTFDLSVISDSITAATLSVENPSGNGTARTYSLFQVSTGQAVLGSDYPADDPDGMAIYEDLGTGTVLGSATPSTMSESPVVVPMNAKGVAALNAARGATISFGGSLIDSDGFDFLFSSTSNSSFVELILTLGSTTKLTIKAPSRVPKGTRAKISGKLSATPAAAACTAAQTLKISVGTKKLTRTTAAGGSYSFKARIAKKTKVTVRYAANANCTASRVSKIIRVS